MDPLGSFGQFRTKLKRHFCFHQGLSYMSYIYFLGEQLTAVAATQSSTFTGAHEHPAAYCIDGDTGPGEGS